MKIDIDKLVCSFMEHCEAAMKCGGLTSKWGHDKFRFANILLNEQGLEFRGGAIVPSGDEAVAKACACIQKQGEQKDILKDVILDSNEDGLIAETIKVGKAKKSQRMESAKAKEALLNDVSKKDQHSNEESPCLREIEFQYHTPSASLLPYREEHNMLVDLDCANLLRLICKNLSSLQAHEVHPWLAYLAGVFEGSAQLRQRMIEQQKNNGI